MPLKRSSVFLTNIPLYSFSPTLFRPSPPPPPHLQSPPLFPVPLPPPPPLHGHAALVLIFCLSIMCRSCCTPSPATPNTDRLTTCLAAQVRGSMFCCWNYTVWKAIPSDWRCQNVPSSITDMFVVHHKENCLWLNKDFFLCDLSVTVSVTIVF